MNHRLCLFFAGYCSHAPALYYNHVALLDELKGSEEPPVKDALSRVSAGLIDGHYEPASFLRTAVSIASHFEIKVPQEPDRPDTYFEWRERYREEFEKLFPMSRIDHYYFLYSRKLLELYANAGLAATLLDMKKDLPHEPLLDRKIEKCLKDNEYILFKLIAAAALLSSEPRQNCFNVQYRQLSADFAAFTGVQAEQLSSQEVAELEKGLLDYKKKVKVSLGSCCSVLKELGI